MRCSIINCKSDSGLKIPGLSFHAFPHNIEIRKKWIAACGRGEWVPKKSSKICSKHFNTDHILKTGKLTYIHPNAAPVLIKVDPESNSGTTPLTVISTPINVMLVGAKSEPVEIKKEIEELDDCSPSTSVVDLPIPISESCPAALSMASPLHTSKSFYQKWKKEQKLSKERLKKLKALREKSRRLTKKVTNLESVLIALKTRF